MSPLRFLSTFLFWCPPVRKTIKNFGQEILWEGFGKLNTPVEVKLKKQCKLTKASRNLREQGNTWKDNRTSPKLSVFPVSFQLSLQLPIVLLDLALRCLVAPGLVSFSFRLVWSRFALRCLKTSLFLVSPSPFALFSFCCLCVSAWLCLVSLFLLFFVCFSIFPYVPSEWTASILLNSLIRSKINTRRFNTR